MRKWRSSLQFVGLVAVLRPLMNDFAYTSRDPVSCAGGSFGVLSAIGMPLAKCPSAWLGRLVDLAVSSYRLFVAW